MPDSPDTQMKSLHSEILDGVIKILNSNKDLKDKCKKKLINMTRKEGSIFFLSLDQIKKARELSDEICKLIEEFYRIEYVIYVMKKKDRLDLMSLKRTADLLMQKFETFKNFYITKYQCKCLEANLMFINIFNLLDRHWN